MTKKQQEGGNLPAGVGERTIIPLTMDQKQCNGAEVLPQVPDDLRERLRNQMKIDGLSQRAVSEQIGVSHGALSAWMSGTYKGSNDAIAEAVRGFLSRRREVAESPLPEDERFPTTVETKVYTEVHHALRNCHLKGKIGVVTASSGAGKTRAAKDYAAKNTGVMLIECHHSFPARMVIKAIARSCGVEAIGSIHEMLTAVCDKLRGSGRLLVLDEAEHLKPQVLDVVRRINDWSGIGIVYVGLPRFMAQLQSLRRDYEYIWNRVRVRAGIERTKAVELADVKLLIESMMPVDSAVQDAFHACCGGDIRKLEAVFFSCLAISRVRGLVISSKMVASVAKQLEMEAI
jgi:DNA transposition AAA+ family ATPase